MLITFEKTARRSPLTIRIFEPDAVPVNQTAFKAENNEIYWQGAEELWVGIGKKPSSQSVLKTLRLLFHKRREHWPQQIVLDAKQLEQTRLEAAINGMILGGYNLQLYKTEPKAISSFFGDNGELILLVDQNSEDKRRSVEKAQLTALTQSRIMDLMNAPGNKKPPRMLAEWALASGREYHYKVSILEKDALTTLGMEALLSVSKGSSEPPVMIIADYTPESYVHTIALIGKGVTFDTGGISLKDSNQMHLMKSDMGGAGAVLGTIEMAARIKLPVRIIGIIPSTENCIDGDSTKPGDVIGSYSGKTIEVIDTDAEGRLILADALSYTVRNYKPDTIIDLATLTGSVIQTLGYSAAGLFSNDETLATALIQAGENTGERLWRLPLWDDYKQEIESDIADVKNHHGKPLAGAIVAAKFLEVFTEQHPSWAHLDIAGMAFGDTDITPNRAGTAYGIRLLINYLENLP